MKFGKEKRDESESEMVTKNFGIDHKSRIC